MLRVPTYLRSSEVRCSSRRPETCSSARWGLMAGCLQRSEAKSFLSLQPELPGLSPGPLHPCPLHPGHLSLPHPGEAMRLQAPCPGAPSPRSWRRSPGVAGATRGRGRAAPALRPLSAQETAPAAGSGEGARGRPGAAPFLHPCIAAVPSPSRLAAPAARAAQAAVGGGQGRRCGARRGSARLGRAERPRWAPRRRRRSSGGDGGGGGGSCWAPWPPWPCSWPAARPAAAVSLRRGPPAGAVGRARGRGSAGREGLPAPV